MQPETIDDRSSRQVVAISANTSWNIVNFRSRLIGELVRRGSRVVVLAPEDEHSSELRELGAEFVPIEISSSGTSMLEDLRLLVRYWKILRRLKPEHYLGVTIKPNLYGSLAAHAVGARVINNVSGLGPVFIEPGLLTRIVSLLYRASFRRSSTVFFQNLDDMQLFLDRRIVSKGQVELLPGSGVDLERFKPDDARRDPSAPFRFLFVGRLQWTKGIAEYVDAARIVRKTHPGAVFQILGSAGANELKAVPFEVVERWRAEGIIEYLGATNDVRPMIREADCIVLPSYREGLPRTLLEGSAMGKPVIATDVPGCSRLVEHGINGLLCEARSARSLAAAMIRMVELSALERTEMGRRGRRKVEQEYCETVVIAKYLRALGMAA